MRYVRKTEFFARLRKRYPFDSQYFYSGRAMRLPERRLSMRAGIERLVRETLRVFTRSLPGAIVAFNDGLAGWQGVPRRRRHDPLLLEPGCDLRAFIQEQMCFRDPDGYADNYYFTTPELKWFVVFCHEGDWHFMGPQHASGRHEAEERRKPPNKRLDLTVERMARVVKRSPAGQSQRSANVRGEEASTQRERAPGLTR